MNVSEGKYGEGNRPADPSKSNQRHAYEEPAPSQRFHPDRNYPARRPLSATAAGRGDRCDQARRSRIQTLTIAPPDLAQGRVRRGTETAPRTKVVPLTRAFEKSQPQRVFLLY
jgi:hypothetical protein